MLPWNAGARRLYQYAARELGVRLDVPWKDLTDSERDIVLHGEPVQRRVRFRILAAGPPGDVARDRPASLAPGWPST